MADRSSSKSKARPVKRVELPLTVPKAGKSARGRTGVETTPLVLRARGVILDDETREFARQSAGAKLGKFAKRIERITVHLDNISGPTGAPVVACRVRIDAGRIELLVVETEAATARAAIERTLERIERSLRRAIERVETRRTKG